VVWNSGNVLVSFLFDVVAIRQARLELGWVTLQVSRPSRYITSQPLGATEVEMSIM